MMMGHGHLEAQNELYLYDVPTNLTEKDIKDFLNSLSSQKVVKKVSLENELENNIQQYAKVTFKSTEAL